MRWIKRLAAAFLILLAAWGLVIWSEWLPRTTAEQRAALGALEAAPTAAGERNAFAWMHFANFDVPESRFAELAGEDVAAFERWSALRRSYPRTVAVALERSFANTTDTSWSERLAYTMPGSSVAARAPRASRCRRPSRLRTKMVQ
jgi:hypothetical protein